MAKASDAVVEKAAITVAKTLPELIGSFVKGAMENAANLNQYARDLQEWYEARAQVMENRKQLVLDTENAIKTAKGTLEYLFSEYQRMSAKDR